MRLGWRNAGRYIGIDSEGIDHAHDENVTRPKDPISGLRVTLDLLGDGYIEAIPDSELRTLAARETKETRGIIHGELTEVTLPEAAKGAREVGRFGWKDQHGSLASAASEALRNELGLPNEYFPAPPNSARLRAVSLPANGLSQIDHIRALVAFIRSTEPIAPDPERSLLPEVKAGSLLFDRIGCSICHVRTLKTAPPGTKMQDGTLTVSSRLGNREIHPFSDFLLHDVGTGDGVIQNIRPRDYDETTANKFRTPPLWGLRYRSWMMHDGKAITYHQAIMRHGGEAKGVVEAYKHLTPREQEELREFLNSL
ncbi:MAG: di-heme oxidoredictase family protein [Acidobacteriaceae bacterium]